MRLPKFFIIIFFITFLLSGYVYALPSFPGAEGFGADNPGGRGYPVFKVTNILGFNGIAGSFGYALSQAESAGGGYIVFDTSGTIRLYEHIVVGGNITIAGQTSPGGIAIDGSGVNQYTLQFQGSNIIMRHIRLRGTYDDGDGIQIGTLTSSPQSGVVIDHCSVSYYCDGAIDVNNYTNVTIQWTFMGDADECHDEGFHNFPNLWRNESDSGTMHHNIYHNGAQRNPLISTMASSNSVFDIRNNLIYNNWKYDTGIYATGADVNFVGNYWKPGPNTEYTFSGSTPVRPVICGDNNVSFYVYNNRHIAGYAAGALRPNDTYAEWSLAGGFGSGLFGPTPGTVNELSTPVTAPAVTTNHVDSVYELVLEKFGAFPRDSTDRRCEREIRDGDGEWNDDNSRPHDPNVYTGTSQTDADGDGMADNFEVDRFSSTDLTYNGHDLDPDYENIEIYLNELSDYIVAGQEPPWVSSKVEKGKSLIPSLLKFASAHPFTSGIMLGYWVPSSTKNEKRIVKFDIFTADGKLVKNLISDSKRGGSYTIEWKGLDNNGKQVNNGVYICRAVIGEKKFSKKLVMFK